jgi:signal transduction histidine kinase
MKRIRASTRSAPGVVSRLRRHPAGNTRPGADAIQRRRFEGLLAEVSSSFVSTPIERVDAEIEGCVRQLVEFLDVDCGGVVQMLPDGHALHTTYSYSVDGSACFPVIAPDTEFPWLAAQVRQGRVLRLERLPRELPPEAVAEHRVLTHARCKSYVMVPFTVGGSMPGGLGFGARRGRPWPNSLVKRLQLGADIVASALARRREQSDLLECLSFERLISDLVKSVVTSSGDQLGAAIQKGLERVIGHFGVDRTGLGQFAKDGSIIVSHSARRVGVPALSSRIDFGWFEAELAQGRMVRLNEVSTDLPVSAVAEREYARDSGIRSVLSIPLETGGQVWGAISFAAFHESRRWTDEQAQRLRLLGEIMMDALLRREALEGVRRQQEEIAHVARVGALAELTAALAHELNQPLAAVQTNAQTMRRLLAAGRPDDLEQMCADIVGDATRAGDLIHRVRDLLRKREGERQPVSVNEIIEDLQSLAETEVRRHGAQLVLRLRPELPEVVGNAVQLQQVLLNLVRNAAEAMIENEDEHREVMVRTAAPSNEEVTVSIEDEGKPLNEDIFEHLFTPFQTTKVGGVGTGLAISRSIIQAHGGRLWAERRPEGGLVISFALPAQKDDRA